MTQAERPTVIVALNLAADLKDKIAQTCEVHMVPLGKPLDEHVPADVRAKAVGILTTALTPIKAPVFAAFPQLRVSSNMAVGYDNVDVGAASASKVVICNTPGVLDAAVADVCMAFILNLARKTFELERFARDGSWTKGSPPLSMDVAGKTLGLLGMGRIGKVLARRARAFDMNVVYHNRKHDQEAEQAGLASYVGRDELFSQSDFVSVHIPLTPETKGSIGAREFGLMKPSAYFINTARGTVVDEEALIAALKDGKIAGAGLDVMAKEPLDPANPLTSLPNVILQPHIGSGTVETRRAMIELAVDNLLDAVAGRQPKAMVNPEVWDAVAQKAAK